MSNPKPHRVGQFRIPSRYIYGDTLAAQEIFQGMVVLRAEYRPDWDGIEYMAMGAMFDEVEACSMCPWYEVTYHNKLVTFENVGEVDQFSATFTRVY